MQRLNTDSLVAFSSDTLYDTRNTAAVYGCVLVVDVRVQEQRSSPASGTEGSEQRGLSQGCAARLSRRNPQGPPYAVTQTAANSYTRIPLPQLA